MNNVEIASGGQQRDSATLIPVLKMGPQVRFSLACLIFQGINIS